jgi:Flp pilus assembly protein TadD
VKTEANTTNCSTHNDVTEYQKALNLAETGNHEQALEVIREYLISQPNNVEALNDTGVILHCLGRSDEAITHLFKAKSLAPDSGEIIWNLCEAYLADSKPGKAVELFEDMQRLEIFNADILNRTADEFLNNGKLAEAAEMLKRSLELLPEQEILTPMIEVIRSKITAES